MQKRGVEEPGAAEEQGKRDAVEGKAGEVQSRTLTALIGFKGGCDEGIPEVPTS